MTIFISWSGETSKRVALHLKRWIRQVIQSADTWMSEHDIGAGAQWAKVLEEALESADYGIICLTPDNRNCPWLMYEAGALANALGHEVVVPYRIGLQAPDVQYPLAMFNSVAADRDGTWKMLCGLNKIPSLQLEEDRLVQAFDLNWPELDDKLQKLPPADDETAKRPERDLLEELIEQVRALDRSNREMITSARAGGSNEGRRGDKWWRIKRTTTTGRDFLAECRSCEVVVSYDPRENSYPPARCPACDRG